MKPLKVRESWKRNWKSPSKVLQRIHGSDEAIHLYCVIPLMTFSLLHALHQHTTIIKRWIFIHPLLRQQPQKAEHDLRCSKILWSAVSSLFSHSQQMELSAKLRDFLKDEESTGEEVRIPTLVLCNATREPDFLLQTLHQHSKIKGEPYPIHTCKPFLPSSATIKMVLLCGKSKRCLKLAMPLDQN